MNNSSAYANVLLKTPALKAPVLKVPAPEAPKHDYKNDDASADFHQTLKNVHDSQKSQDDKVHKPANPKKSTQVEHHHDAKNTKVVKEAKATNETVAKQKSADDSADTNQNSIGSEAVCEQPLPHKNNDMSADKSTDGELAQEATALVTDINPEESLDVSMILNTPSGVDISVTQASLVVDTELMTVAEPTSMPEIAVSIDQTASQSLANPATPAGAQVLAASVMASAAPVKPLQPQVALAEMSEVSDEVIDLLTPLVAEAAASAKSASASSVTTSSTVDPEVTTAQVQMNASKSAFEKTLQTIVSADASGADDMATSLSNSSSTSSATNPLIDSLMRGMDQQAPTARSFVVQTAVPIPVGQPQWSQAVGERVLWLAAQNVSSAEINLHPKDLGPMQVRVSVNQEQTTVSFTSQHAVVREVLDQNLNRLRDMFSEQGLNLVNVDVSDKSFSRQQSDAQDQKGQGGANDVAQDEETAVAMSTIVQQRLVDHYA